MPRMRLLTGLLFAAGRLSARVSLVLNYAACGTMSLAEVKESIRQSWEGFHGRDEDIATGLMDWERNLASLPEATSHRRNDNTSREEPNSWAIWFAPEDTSTLWCDSRTPATRGPDFSSTPSIRTTFCVNPRTTGMSPTVVMPVLKSRVKRRTLVPY
jgi:hypothetical protein